MSVSLFESKDLSPSLWKKVLDRAVSIKNQSYSVPEKLSKFKVGMLFFEPSSRTRWSFEKACLDLSVPSMVSIVDDSTSKSKGETSADTLDLYLELGFDLVVVRSSGDSEVLKRLSETKVPFINAGFGKDYHPTQALLDYFTWSSEVVRPVSKILIMGDVAHSRVAKSHLRFSKIMGYEVGLLPAEGLELSESDQKALKPDQNFKDRKEALDWAEVVMSLRTQKERHSEGSNVKPFEVLNKTELRKDHIIMHPGPFMRGEDLEDDLVRDSRSLIFNQKRNGVYCRAALMSCLLEENQKEKKGSL
jgi:aspartate carbamoyltransferase catalytic subunit